MHQVRTTKRIHWMVIASIIACFLLAGCMHSDRTPVFYQCQTKPCTTPMLTKRLGRQGVGVIRVGETMRIVILSDEAFNPDSANFRVSFQPALNNIATLIGRYEKVRVKVTGYTAAGGNERRNVALSEAQANSVARYLWRTGCVDVRLLHATGKGALHPVSSNDFPHGRSDNRRVEITFRYIVS